MMTYWLMAFGAILVAIVWFIGTVFLTISAQHEGWKMGLLAMAWISAGLATLITAARYL